MSPETHEQNQGSNTNRYYWIAGAAGAAAGIAWLVYSRRETPWEKARRRAFEFAEAARDRASDVELKPWMGVAAGAAAAGTAGLAAYKRRRRGDPIQDRAEEVAERAATAVQPWLAYATKAVLNAVAMARDPQNREAVSDGASDAAAKVAATSMRLARRVQQLSGETRKLYPSVRKLMA